MIYLLLSLSLVHALQPLDPVHLQVNRVFDGNNALVSLPYYSLPFCRPQNVYDSPQSLGETLQGDRRQNSLYSIQYRKSVTHQTLCNVTLSQQQVQSFELSIRNHYMAEYFVEDQLVVDPVGEIIGTDAFLKTHLNLTIYFSQQKINQVVVHTDPTHDYSLLDQDDEDGQNLSFSYSVQFVYSQVPSSHAAMDHKTHWAGVLVTLGILLSLVVMVANILRQTIQQDIATIRKSSGTKEVRWKYIRKEILMVPPMRNVLASLLGVGVQILFCLGGLSMLALGHFYNHNHGDFMTYAVLLYCFSGCVNGYVSNTYYQYLLGQRWIMNCITCALLLPLGLALAMLPAYILELSQSFTTAVPLNMVLYIMGLLCFINLPSVLLGALYARRRQKDRLPINQQLMCSKNIPSRRWFKSSMFYFLVAGCLPFTAVSVEIYYVMQSVWSHKAYHLSGIMVLLLALILCLIGLVTIMLIYFTISEQDYRWWWKSLLYGSSIGLYVLIYSAFFWYTSNMKGLLTGMLYALYSIVFASLLSLIGATVGFIFTHRFIRQIYQRTRVI